MKNFAIRVTAVAYFAAAFPGWQMRLRILREKLLIISQRFFGAPPFRFYAKAEGIRRILAPGGYRQTEPPPRSLRLALRAGLGGFKNFGKALPAHD